MSYLIYSEDKFSNLTCAKPSWTVKLNHFSSGIDLVLLSTLSKFIVGSLGFEPNPVLGPIQFQSLHIQLLLHLQALSNVFQESISSLSQAPLSSTSSSYSILHQICIIKPRHPKDYNVKLNSLRAFSSNILKILAFSI